MLQPLADVLLETASMGISTEISYDDSFRMFTVLLSMGRGGTLFRVTTVIHRREAMFHKNPDRMISAAILTARDELKSKVAGEVEPC